MKILKITNRAQATCEGAFTYIPIDSGLSVEILYEFDDIGRCEIKISKTVPIIIAKETKKFAKVSFSTDVVNKGCSINKVTPSKGPTQIQISHKGLSKEKWEKSLEAEGQKLFDNFIENDKKLLHFDKELQAVMDKKIK